MKRAATVLAVAVLAAGCSSSGPHGDAGGTAGTGAATLGGSITVYSASSLTEAFDALKSSFTAAHPGTKITITYGASSELSTQISQGAPADVFASASEKNMAALGSTAAGRTDFVSNTLEIAVPPGNPGKLASIQDLGKPGLKIAMCDPAVPCGVVASEVLTKAKISVEPVATESDVKSTLAAVESGEVDAGLVYVTDVHAAGDQVEGIAIPAGVNAKTTYPIATIKGSHNVALAQAFVDYVLSADGKRVLAADGFSNP